MITIDINNTTDVTNKLKNLDANAKPLWGKMSPQHIVEHLEFSLQMSTGKSPQKLHFSDDVANTIKQKIIYSADEIPEGVKNPVLGDEPPPFVHPDLQTAIEKLLAELDYFHSYYKEHPEAKHIQPRMGILSHEEWVIFYNKHFTHHFKQHNLL